MKVLVYPALEVWGDVADEFHGFELQPEFDALEALRTEGLLPPNPRVRPLDNLHKCRRILPTVSLSNFLFFFSRLFISALPSSIEHLTNSSASLAPSERVRWVLGRAPISLPNIFTYIHTGVIPEFYIDMILRGYAYLMHHVHLDYHLCRSFQSLLLMFQ
jgi:hypothetical protein